MKTILRYQKTKVMGGRLKVVTYNVNGLRQRIAQFGSLLNLLSSLDADIICFQEIKLTRQELTADLVMAEGYESFFSCTRTYGKGRIGYSGVATFCRVKSAYSSTEVTLPVAAEEGFTGLLESSRGTELRNGETFADVECLEEFTREELLKLDNEGRCIITDHGHFVLFNIYGPRADSDDAERIEFKSNFYKVLQKRWEALQQQKRRIIVVGDLNIAPAAVDRCEAGPDFEKNEFRKWFRSLLVKNGGSFYDIFREKHPERKDAYTCWPVHTGAEEFNFGSRIDHILASGLCLHQVDDPSGHNLLDCHVEECDIMTQFRRWKPGITPRWNGGRITKLEGSDHVPVYAALKEVHDSPLHNTPPLSARYIPEIRGFQQTIVSILMKRKMSEQINVSVVSSSSPNEDSKHLTLSENAEATLPTCSVSSMDVVEDDSKCSENVENMTKTKSEHNSLIYGTQKKKKVKQNQHSQLSLKSFFQRVSNSESVGNPDEDMPRNEENISNSYNFPKEIPEFNDEIRPERNASTEERDEPTASCSSQNDKNAALLEWRRIQQLMQDSIPLCEGHREPCVSRVVKKPGTNFGRRFYCCARAEGPTSNPETRCDFFRWAGSKPKRK